MAIRRTLGVLLAAALFTMNVHAQAPSHQGLPFNGDSALNAMHEGHQLWLTSLKDRSEKH
jgi:hypothetical protein